MSKILVVDDDAATRQLVATIAAIVADGRPVLQAENGLAALAIARAEAPDLIVSDVDMPELDGLGLCRAVRAEPALAHTRVLLLTALGARPDVYAGFQEGADDYLAKPFDAVELQLRLRAMLRPAAAPAPAGDPSLLQVGELKFEPKRSMLSSGDRAVTLTESECAIVAMLGAQPERLFSTQQVLEGALGYPRGVGNPQVVHTHVKNIRAKLREAGINERLLASSRQGYALLRQPPESAESAE